MIKLDIQRFAETIGYIPIVATETGVNATTGAEMETAFNTNFNNVTDAVNNIFSVLQYMVGSETVTLLKADAQGRLYFSTDDPSTPSQNVHWTSVSSVFANIQGDPYDNIALATALNSKASSSDVTNLTNRVSTAEQNISTNTGKITQNTNNISSNTSNITSIQNTLNYVVRTNGVQTPLYLRYINNKVEISTDNITWVDINTLDTYWDSIAGNPSDNTDLTNYITSLINNELSNYVTSSSLSSTLSSYYTSSQTDNAIAEALDDVATETYVIDQVNAAMSGIPTSAFTNQYEYRSLFYTDYEEVPEDAEFDSEATYYIYNGSDYVQVSIDHFEPGVTYYIQIGHNPDPDTIYYTNYSFSLPEPDEEEE